MFFIPVSALMREPTFSVWKSVGVADRFHDDTEFVCSWRKKLRGKPFRRDPQRGKGVANVRGFRIYSKTLLPLTISFRVARYSKGVEKGRFLNIPRRRRGSDTHRSTSPIYSICLHYLVGDKVEPAVVSLPFPRRPLPYATDSPALGIYLRFSGDASDER